LALVLVHSISVTAEPPSAFDLLKQVRRIYTELETYSDLGEIEKTVLSEGSERTTLQFFETAVNPTNRFLWRIHGESPQGFEERAVWSDGRQAYVYSNVLQQYKPISSIVAELAHGTGSSNYEALVVPLLLAGHEDVLADPDGAAVEGPEPCGEAFCWILSLSYMAGAIETELQIDHDTLMIHEVLVKRPSESMTIHVSHHRAPPSAASFVPPAGARRVAAWKSKPRVDELEVEAASTPGFHEEITVALFSVVARIVDSHGSPVVGLGPADLLARVGKQPVPIVSVDWVSSSQPSVEIPAAELAEARRLARLGDLTMAIEPDQAAGRLVIFFLQVDLVASRVKGFLKILPDVEQLLASLHPDDRVAIVSFDSHLKLWQDFTTDRGATFELLKKAIRYGKPRPLRSPGVSLFEYFDFPTAQDVATPERALRLTAEALTPLAGEKDIIYLGWGLGRYGGAIRLPGGGVQASGVSMTAEYEPAIRALDAARATVSVLDVSQADYHSLEVGLQNVAAHTGGTYERTLHFASQAVRRLARTLGGYYVVNIDRSELPTLRGPLILELETQKGKVLFKPITLG